MKKRHVFGASVVALLVGFYLGNNMGKVVTPQDLAKELKVLFQKSEETSSCSDCDTAGFKSTKVDVETVEPEFGETIFDQDAGSLDGGGE